MWKPNEPHPYDTVSIEEISCRDSDFLRIDKKGYLYIDKTEYVYRMTHSNSKYMFLSRPCRFGKSLLTSTLRTYCGITEEEMRMQMDADLDAFAGKTGMDKEQLVEKLIMTVITLRGPLLIFIILIA